MNTHEYYVSLEVAKLLKDAGFNWGTFYCYRNDIENIEMCHVAFNWNMNKKDYEKEGSDNIFHGFITSDAKGLVVDDFISAPTFDAAQRWLRENKDFDINVLTDFDSVKRLYYVRYVVKDGHYKTYYISNNRSYVYFNTFEEALEAGIKKALEIILEKGE